MALRKAFPKERKYDFWNILMCYFINQHADLPENERKLFGALANRMILKATPPSQGDRVSFMCFSITTANADRQFQLRKN